MGSWYRGIDANRGEVLTLHAESGRLRRVARLPVRVARFIARLLRQPSQRHRVRARVAAERRRLVWGWRRILFKRRNPDRPIILVGMVEHMGDIVAAEPVVRYLRREYPNGYLIWAVKDTYRELVEHHPTLDAILPLGCLTEWIHLAGSRIFDQVIDLQVQGRDCAVCKVPLVKPQGDQGVTFDTYYTLGNLLHVFCRAATLPTLDEAPRLYMPDAVRQHVDGLELPPAYVAIHCASNQQERDWSPVKWRELTEQIVSTTGLPVVEVGLHPVVGSSLPGYIDLCGRLSLLETADVIRRAQVFIGIDSGPAHLANAVRTYGIILLGEYGPFKKYLPYSGAYADGSNARILYGDGPAATIPVEWVLDALPRHVLNAPVPR